MICVKFTAFYDLREDLQISLATLRKSVRKLWFWKNCVDLRVRLARALNALEPYSVLKRSGEAGIVRHSFRKDTETYPT